ncbi:MAG: site-specific integrase [Methylomonas sp.]|uniref:tyrosine-type recombinase/integrase n=1 Tax=Methylomonas sp. TaxID=418 RepID=UPI0025D708DA|nr:tyrosine-type recombinase/integrase [Methylomonas sp.]MCK9608933.1 site-specific integrase [Methylomonas sp.]
MGRKNTSGLYERQGVWHIDKQIKGYGRLCESCKTSDREEAEQILMRKLVAIREQQVFGVRPQRTFRQAATKFLTETNKRSIARDADCLKNLDPFIGDLLIENVHMGTLQHYINHRRKQGIKSSTVARELAIVRRILTLAARVWRDDNNKSWLETAPLLEMPKWEDSSEPYPLNWTEQARFFSLLPEHLQSMAMFKVNTGLREQSVCWLRWEWEVKVPELETSVFVIPGRKAVYDDGVWPGEKNKEDQIVVLNRIAREVIEKQRGKHSVYVFAYEDHRIYRMHNTGWKNAWKKAGLPTDGSYKMGPHNLKHTFGRRLRAAGVPLETRKALLHHTNGDITTHYSSVELEELIDAVELIAGGDSRKSPALTLIRKKSSRPLKLTA